jgi:hypothetical protein
MMRRLFAAALALTFLIAGFVDAAVTATPVFVQTPKLGSTTFVQGTDAAGTYKTVIAGGANGTKVTAIWVTMNDGTATHLVTVQLSTSSSAHCSPQSNCLGGAAITIPLSSGFANAASAVHVLSSWPGLPTDSDGNPYIYLGTTVQTIEATYATALTVSTQISVVAVVADF